MYQKRIFVGSSSESKEFAEKVVQILENLGCIPMPWWKNGMFPAGENTFDSILRSARSADASLFILAEDDSIRSRNEASKATRDNVLIEAGVFYGAHGKTGVGLCSVGHPKTPTDWNGINIIKYEKNKDNTLQVAIKSWLKNVKRKNNKGPHNVHMQARGIIDSQYSLRERMGFCDEGKAYENIIAIKILNLASLLILDPYLLEPSTTDLDHLKLGEIIFHILENNKTETKSLAKATSSIGEMNSSTDEPSKRTVVELILPRPSDNILNDYITKTAVEIQGKKSGIYAVHDTLYNLLKENTVIQAAVEDGRFRYQVTDICIPFAIFAVEYKHDFSFLNHVKIDLYSSYPTDAKERRSMVIWQEQDGENYQFFLNNFNSIRDKATRPTEEEMKKWAEKWKK